MAPSPHGKFNKTEAAAFAPGGQYSTPHQREGDNPSDFLDQADRKYPYKVRGRISCNLLKAAVSRSAQQGDTAINKRAKALYDENCV